VKLSADVRDFYSTDCLLCISLKIEFQCGMHITFHALVTVGAAILLSGSTCQNGHLPSSSRETIRPFSTGVGGRGSLGKQQANPMEF
jgi:hypothetical protein